MEMKTEIIETGKMKDKNMETQKIEAEKILIKKSHLKKDRAVKKLAEKIKNAKTLLIVNIKSLPSRQFQSIKKTIRNHASIKVAKKNIMLRALKEIKKESILELKDHIQENCAFAISDLEGFELSGILIKNKNPVFAKAGQIAPEEIEIKEGPTSLAPGPAISEFGALGVQIAVEDGKIAVKKAKVILTKGQEIKENIASLLQKLDIKPFEIGIEPVVIYDIESEKIYKNIEIDPEQAKQDLSVCAGKALGFAQKIVYVCRETIGYLLSKANAHANALERLDIKQEIKSEEKAEEKKPEEVNVNLGDKKND